MSVTMKGHPALQSLDLMQKYCNLTANYHPNKRDILAGSCSLAATSMNAENILRNWQQPRKQYTGCRIQPD